MTLIIRDLKTNLRLQTEMADFEKIRMVLLQKLNTAVYNYQVIRSLLYYSNTYTE